MASDYFIAHRMLHSGMEFHYSISQSQKPTEPFVRHRIGGAHRAHRGVPDLPKQSIFGTLFLSPPLSPSLSLPI